MSSHSTNLGRDSDPLEDILDCRRRQTDQLLYQHYLIVRALAKGTKSDKTGHSRPKLPTNIICQICLFLDLFLPNRSMSAVSTNSITVRAPGSESVSRPWFRTIPFTGMIIKDIVSIQLITHSADQGWTSVPDTSEWSWFSIQVFKPGNTTQMHSVGNQTVPPWESHSNHVASSKVACHKGRTFDHNHSIWAHLNGGCYIEILVNAKYGGWSNHAQQGVLEICTRWNPSKEFLDIAGALNNPHPAANRSSTVAPITSSTAQQLVELQTPPILPATASPPIAGVLSTEFVPILPQRSTMLKRIKQRFTRPFDRLKQKMK